LNRRADKRKVDQVKRFLNVRGTGTVPEGNHLWVFVYTPDEQFYHPAGARTKTADFVTDLRTD
jgi:hypothetical protein